MRFLLTAGQRHDITQAEALIEAYAFARLIADTSYDADGFRQVLADKNADSRFDKLAQRYLGFLSLAAATIWLR